MPATTVFHLSAECYPIAKVGGLADVVGALPKYQNELGVEAMVIMPFYETNFVKKNKFVEVFSGQLMMGDFNYAYKILSPKESNIGFGLFLVYVEGLMDRERVYSYPDDVERFMAFQIGVLNWMAQLPETPDVVHCHDHHTGLIPFMMQYCIDYSSLKDIPTILTIHNAQYQGWFGFDRLQYFPAFDLKHVGFLDWAGMINPLATAIKCVWRVTTVSPTYMEELMHSANGLESLLANERPKCIGILNGVDSNVWNPESDSFIPKNYSKESVAEGKKASKDLLCNQFGLNPEKPLFAFIGRLVYEKGTDLLPDAFIQLLSSIENNGNYLVLGSGDPETEENLKRLHDWYPDSYNSYIGYDEPLSHLIYAGADFLLMPSRVEPCGLNQMYALRYGTIPIVNSIGGLIDTVTDIVEENGFGIRHGGPTSGDIVNAIFRGQELFEDKERFVKFRKRIMDIDHSWNASVKKYLDVYNEILKIK